MNPFQPATDPADTRTMRLRETRKLTVFGITLMAMGLLLWARLILVTGRPRMAIAQPEESQPEARPARSKPQTPSRTPENEMEDPRLAPAEIDLPVETDPLPDSTPQ